MSRKMCYLEMEKRGKQDIHKEIENSISQKMLHVPVRPPPLGCFVYFKRLLQDLDDSENQECNAKNKSQDCGKYTGQECGVG